MKSDYDVVAAAIDYLEQNFRRQPELGDVAGYVGLSEAHFQRLFRRWAGISPKRFLQFLTAEHARELLRESRSVLDVSYQVGLSGGGRLHDLMLNVTAATPGEVKSGGAGMTIQYGFHDSPFGESLIAMTERGLCALAFAQADNRDELLRELRARWPNAELVEAPAATRSVARQIFGDSAGAITLFLKGTNFQIRVWEALLRVPAGRAVTYEDIAHGIGRPTATRAVGAAIGQNPIAYLIPCHRVLRKSGVFGEYHWGGTRKKALLAWESAHAGVGAA
ncbi:MAG TPA: methylated-DNA--[protein]-cysteine S-methyltransferase [Longimicrobiales bacterium]|nr:methylated-DNA--[protein]-cysteine S-methyltransferase [Longimicrobiales bacterium]